MSDIYSDKIGRTYCAAHRKDDCHVCCMTFVETNEMAEIRAGLRKAPSRAEELAKEKIMLQRGLAFMMQQSPETRRTSMKGNIDFHKTELTRVEREIKELQSGKNNGDLQQALAKEIEKARGQDAELRALASAHHQLHPESNTMEFGGPETQMLYEKFVAPPPSAQRDQTVDPYTCSYCRKTGTEMLPACSRCKKQAYCSKECQKIQWKAHKKECVPVERLDKQDTKKLPLSWEQLEAFGTATAGQKLEVRFVDQEPGLRLIALCKDRVGVTKRVAAYTSSRNIPGFGPGKVMVWKNPRFHYFMDGSNGARIEDQDLANVTIKD